MTKSVVVELRLRNLRQKIDNLEPVRFRIVTKKWAARYRSWAQERFDTFSRGGGDWPPLLYRIGSILRNTGTLFNVLNPVFAGSPGAIEEDIPYGVKVGYGGPHRHPGGGVSIADIALFHQEGAGNLPVRKTIVPPPETVLQGMRNDVLQSI